MRTLSRLVEVCKQFLKRTWQTHVRMAGGGPVLCSYSSDGTPISTTQQCRSSISTGGTVKRFGRGTSEYLVQGMFSRYLDAQDQAQTCVVLRDPLPLTEGKAAWQLFSCCLEFGPTLREEGHLGLALHHYCFDRACYKPLTRAMIQHHRRLAARFGHGSSQLTPQLLELQEWVLSTACGCHDAHNSLKWAMHAQMNDPELTKSVYLVIESLRNAFDLLAMILPSWMASKLAPKEEHELHPEEQLHAVYTALGLDPELVELLACELRLCWRNGELQVKSSALQEQDGPGKVYHAVMSVWKFDTFSTSRWVSVGSSCRSLTAALMLGLDSVVACIRSNPKNSDYYIGGYARLGAEARRFVVIAALASYVPDALLRELMEDSRVPLRMEHLKSSIAQEMSFLSQLGIHVWEALAPVTQSAPQSLRSEVLQAAQTSSAFVEHRVFSAASRLPWKLCTGDIDQNLQELMASIEPREPTSQKVWQLLHLGWNKLELRKAIMLMADCPWATVCAEQQHGSASIIRKYHEHLGEESLMSRAFAHTMRRLLPGMSVEEKQIARARQRLERLDRKRPDNLGGRQLYVRDLMSVAADWQKDGTRCVPGRVQHVIMKKHGDRWKGYPASTKLKYDARAALARSASRQQLEEETERARTDLCIMVSRLEASKEARPPLTLSACQLGEQEQAVLQCMWDDAAFTHRMVGELRAAAAKAPLAPSRDVQTEMRALAIYEGDDPPARPAWLSPLCWHRAHMAGCALAVATAEGKSFYLFLYATQSPLFACFSRLHVEELLMEPQEMNLEVWDRLAVQHWAWSFTVDYQATTTWDVLSHVGPGQLEVLPGLVHLGNSEVVSDAELMPWGELLGSMPSKAPAGSSGERTAAPKDESMVSSALLQQHPWLAAYAQASGDDGDAGESSVASQGRPHASAEVPGEELSEEQLDEIFNELHKKREGWDEKGAAGLVHFRYHLLGGAWFQSHRAKAYDAFLGSARGAGPAEWRRQHGLQKSARFEMGAHGEHGSFIMA